MDMTEQLLARCRCLEFKLDNIRDFCEDHLSMNPDNIELRGVLELISRYETVPAEFYLKRPFVKRRGEDNAIDTRTSI